MHILSDPRQDSRMPEKPGGSYEWWYFDAVSADGKMALVIIFYEGIPFSPRYADALKNGEAEAGRPEYHPAVSISVYREGRPVYYSLVEYGKANYEYQENPLSVVIGRHRFERVIDNGEVSYRVTLREELASGDSIDADLLFLSTETRAGLLSEGEGEDHLWNLAQPTAEVKGEIRISGFDSHEIKFDGNGYHDHNYGAEPMKAAFRDWYWGRVHFPEAALVYYVMNGHHEQQYRAWLISRDNRQIVTEFDAITLEDRQLTGFGLSIARRLTFASGDVKAEVFQSNPVDSGPFYVRFLSDGVLHVPEWGLQKQTGITEYIYPSRIDWKLFRPLIRMRYRYGDRNPHWVQRSPRLYRWTW